MSRSNDFSGLSGKLCFDVLLDLLPVACATAVRATLDDRGPCAYLGRCPACRGHHDGPTDDAAIPSGAVIAALVRRCWNPRVARRRVEHDVLGRRYRHVPRLFADDLRRLASPGQGPGRARPHRRHKPWLDDRGHTFW